MRVALTVFILVSSSAAQASDKGLRAELITGLVPLVCDTTIAADLAPIVQRQHRLAIAKMSQASLASEVDSMDAAWRAIATTHARALQKTAPSARTRHLVGNDAFLRETVTAALPAIARRCPKKARTDPDAVLELLVRRLGDLPTAPAPEHSTPTPPAPG
jgi:hypothetical protein